mgnify:CR=1 FL=1
MLTVADGELRCTRIFDVADTLDLERCLALITQGGADPRRLSLRREGSEYLQLSEPPLLVALGPRRLSVGGGERAVRVEATLFHHGAISITVQVPVEAGSTFETLTPLADELYDSRALDALALDEVNKLSRTLAPAHRAPHRWDQNEGYTVVFVRRFGGATSADEVLAAPGLARLLLGEQREPRLSAAEEAEVLGHHFSYTPEDLVVIEWNAALVYEPSGSEDVVDLLEIANAQLLELRYYDQVLDQELARMYEVVGRQHSSLLRSPYKQAMREQLRTLIELSSFLERVENVLKIVGDVYLARVYEAALKQLRVVQWTAQVSRKHRLLQQIYELMKGEVDTGRALTLETMVVLLILLEIVLAFTRLGH